MPKFELNISSEAREELELAVEWYNHQEAGLGDEFGRYIKGTLERIQENPYLFQDHGGNRRVGHEHDKFPYQAVYQIDEINQTIDVLSIHHYRQNLELKMSERQEELKRIRQKREGLDRDFGLDR